MVKYNDDERANVVSEYVYDILTNDISVIVIDDYLDHGEESYLTEVANSRNAKLKVFNNWTDEMNSENNRMLSTCNSFDGKMIIHTRSQGGRGVDFKLHYNTHVILIKEPKYILDLQ